MIRSELLPVEYSGCVVTVSQARHDPDKQYEKTFTNTDYYNVEKNNPSLYHNAIKTEYDGQCSCSGVIVDRSLGLALCHGAIFFPFLKKSRKDFSAVEHNILRADNFVSDLIIQVECQSQPRKNKITSDHFNSEGLDQRPGLDLIPMSNQTKPQTKRTLQQAQLLMLVPCLEFQMAFSRLFNKAEGWVFSNEEEKHEYGELQKDLAYLHWFALLKVHLPLIDGHNKISLMKSSKLLKGSVVFACGSPFGSFYPDIFLNTVSKGVLSNMAGNRNVVLLTDARCLPGSEGGGIFAIENSTLHLVGIIVSPLCWKSNEWVGLTVACSISHILENIVKSLDKTSISVKNDLTAMQSLESCVTDLQRGPGTTELLMAAVVLVDSGPVWGSGVLINPKVVLTCRHVVRNASKVSVKIRPPSAQVYQILSGRVVFSTQETSPYDIAVVELEESFPGIPEPVLVYDYRTGEDVCVLGFGAFGESSGPSVTSGVLSAVISVGGHPVMLQSTCAVHAGSSGGPMFAAQTGELLGIVASNTRDNSTGATYPHLNFSTPITVLQPALQRYIQFGDLCTFQELNMVGHAVRDVWRLQRNPENVLLSKL
ncbi:peroxisomal leader peptide-processing protease [Rhinophrynus dorsalis]